MITLQPKVRPCAHRSQSSVISYYLYAMAIGYFQVEGKGFKVFQYRFIYLPFVRFFK